MNSGIGNVAGECADQSVHLMRCEQQWYTKMNHSRCLAPSLSRPLTQSHQMRNV